MELKFITAIIQPYKLGEVKEALLEVGITGMTVCEVRGFGRQRGHTEVYRGAEHVAEFLPKTRIEIVVDEGQVDRTIEAIVRAARTSETGKVGDGKVFVSPVERSLSIRAIDKKTE